MRKDEALKMLQPYVDGELDAATCVELERHLADDAAARAKLDVLRALSATIRGGAEYHAAPAALRDRVAAIARAPQAELARLPGRRRFEWLRTEWVRVAGFSTASAALAALLTFAILRPTPPDPLERDAFASHVRAVVGERLIDVASSDQHAVKPWLSARLGFSPPVHDYSGSGFELAGARVDVIGGERAAVLVYKRRLHMIDVLVQPARAEQSLTGTARNGYNLLHFARDGMSYWLVSDLNRPELTDLAKLLGSREGK